MKVVYFRGEKEMTSSNMYFERSLGLQFREQTEGKPKLDNQTIGDATLVV